MGYVTGTPWTGMGYVTGTPWTGMGYVTGTPWTAMNYITLGGLSSTATGLTYTNTTGVFSLTSGYVIPTTTSASAWDGKQAGYANLTSMGSLANGTGWL